MRRVSLFIVCGTVRSSVQPCARWLLHDLVGVRRVVYFPWKVPSLSEDSVSHLLRMLVVAYFFSLCVRSEATSESSSSCVPGVSSDVANELSS